MRTHITFLLASILLALPFYSFAQTTRLQGEVRDQYTLAPIAGATVFIQLKDRKVGQITDENGKFEIAEVPVGRHAVRASFVGYQTYQSEPRIFKGARVTYLEIKLLPGADTLGLDDVVITANNFPTQAANDLSVVSTRSFNAEITDRVPAAANDPSRMALAFPGVQQGEDDSENDIIIRGNSSMGMLWRLEGLDIPTPNHFARPGTSGGGLTVFSAQLLDRSDFSTGAFAAEYGNALSGVMDVYFRKGNMQDRQHRVRIGILGLDFSTEGPIKKGRSSYLANYRYSTLSILNRMGFHLVGERVDNDFTDLSFNLAFDGKDGKSFTTVFGLGGTSLENYRPVPEVIDRGTGDEFRTNEWEDRRLGSRMMALGMTHKRLLDKKSYLKFSAAITGSVIFRDYNVLDTLNVSSQYRDEKHLDRRGIVSLVYHRTLSSRTRLKTGIFFHQIFYSFYRENVARGDLFSLDLDNRDVSANGEGQTQTFQYFAQLSHKLSDKATVHVGGHYYLLGLNRRMTLDPRVSFSYDFTRKTNLSLAYGLHSQALPMMIYFYYDQERDLQPNFDLPMMRSHHGVISFSQIFGNSLKLGAELYAQRLFQIPVLANDQGNWNDTTIFWLLNRRESAFDPFVSQGKGLNYGLDVSLEKTFTKGLYFLLTGSLFESKFELPDGRRLDTRFASRWVSSYTIGKEFYLKKSTLQIGGRFLYNGGFRYTPADAAASEAAGFYVADVSRTHELQVQPYTRIDARFAWYWNRKKASGAITLDIQNLTDRRNLRNVGWSNGEVIFTRHPGGLIPVLSFRFDF